MRALPIALRSIPLVRLVAVPVAVLAACTAGTSSGPGPSGDRNGGAGDTTAGADPSAGDAAVGGDSAVSGDSAASGDALVAGTVLFQESFDDNAFGSRGWYDGPNGTIITTNTATGGGGAFECTFMMGATSCDGGKPARIKFTGSESVFVRFYVRHSTNWVGSGQAFHPHLMHVVTNEDSDYNGPANSHLNLYIESPQNRPMLAIQDSRNVDTNCVLRNNNTFVGCNGDFDTYAFTENRSVASCNGLMGDLDGRDCWFGSYWYSSRSWHASQAYFLDTMGPYYKGDWHLIEVYAELNSIVMGVGVADGKIRYWYDGELLISSDAILFRTAQYPAMLFDQFLILPYIGSGSPVMQSIWFDELVVATGRL